MKSASKNWVLIVITFFLFNCGSTTETVIEPVKKIVPSQKALVLVRTEGSEASINQFKETINSDFANNNISTNITIYPLGRPWNNNQIFTTAYNDNYDYIIIMDQVAKFSIDGRTQVGGKYQIRSYHIKSKNPDWLDLGQKTCNISVKPSVNKFSSQVVSSIVPNYKSLNEVDEDEMYASTDQEESQYQSFKSSKEVDDEIAELKRQLKIEQQKTNDALAEKERLEKKYERELAIEKEKTQDALASLDNAKKDVEAKKRLNLIEKEKALTLQKEKDALALAETKRIEKEKRMQLALDKQLKEEQAIAAATKREQKRITKENEQRKIAKEAELVKQQLKESKRLAQAKKEEERLEKLNQIKKEEELAEANTREQKRIAKENKRIEEQEAELVRQQLKESKRLAQAKKESQRLEKLNQLKKDQEIAEANSREQKRIAKENKRIEEQEAELVRQQLKESKRLAQKEAKRIEEETQEANRLKQIEEAKAIAKAKDERLATEKRNAELIRQKEEANALALAKQNAEKKRAEKRKKSKNKDVVTSTKRTKKPGDKTNTLVIIKGKTNNSDNFKNLKTNLEFDFLFAKAKATTIIHGEEKTINKSDILSSNTSYHAIIIVNQLDYVGDGLSNYSISTFNHLTTSTWIDLKPQAFNTSDRESVKKLSKTIVKTLQ